MSFTLSPLKFVALFTLSLAFTSIQRVRDLVVHNLKSTQSKFSSKENEMKHAAALKKEIIVKRDAGADDTKHQ